MVVVIVLRVWLLWVGLMLLEVNINGVCVSRLSNVWLMLVMLLLIIWVFISLMLWCCNIWVRN